MKVMCFDSIYEELIIGNIYTATQSPMWEDCYLLKELPIAFDTVSGFHRPHYNKKYFTPLSSISETEFERDYNFQTA